ncbi:DUF2845 domain-containing protein [Andreprevotia chitinilytica]|uniref:DUF2845 domain-containing protein n=1 Tax=Andreprevotia chitinilytica TaxID=396808 RepID=UPI000692364F|nr:DUF2845 domain-containing protein [Andreprevotia chitinilytica]
MTLHLVFAACIASLSLPAYGESLRCGGAVIDTGDLISRVRDKCGEPERVDIRRSPEYDVYYWYDRHHRRHSRVGGSGEVQVWIYNFGSTQFMNRLTFVNGELSQIDTLDYGH